MISTEILRASMLPQEIVEQKFTRLLSNTINPDTGNLYTVERLAKLFHLSPNRIRNILTGEVSYFLPPEAKEQSLKEPEKAFFVGLALGRFNIDPIVWGKTPFIVIGTESPNPKRRELLKQTIGTKGTIHDFPKATKVYLAPSSFDFLLNPNSMVTAQFFHAKRRFAPFLLGLMASSLSEKKNHITLGNPSGYEKILRAFETQYDFCLGHVVEMGKERSSSLEVENPQAVLASLLQSKDVQSLPFLHALSYPSAIG